MDFNIENICQIVALHKTLQQRDQYTGKHSTNIANLMYDLAAYFGLPAKTQNKAFVAGLVHDIGKMAIPASILNKPGKLTTEEYLYMKKHPNYGVEILTRIGGFESITLEIRHHHERYDGKGYPDGLQGDSIPFMSRMLAVCDTYDAMTTKRCYSAKASGAAALEEIDRCAGSQFDCRMAQVFLSMMRNNIYRNTAIVNLYKTSFQNSLFIRNK